MSTAPSPRTIAISCATAARRGRTVSVSLENHDVRVLVLSEVFLGARARRASIRMSRFPIPPIRPSIPPMLSENPAYSWPISRNFNRIGAAGRMAMRPLFCVCAQNMRGVADLRLRAARRGWIFSGDPGCFCNKMRGRIV
jgi:hypothetical protein